jgi:hypothetical protein
MSWTYEALKTAIAALSPAPVGYDAIAAALNAQTVEVVQPFQWKAVKTIVQISLSWSKVVLRARLSDGTEANLAAINAYETADDLQIDPTNTTAVGTLTAGLEALLAIGDITAADVTAIQALMAPVAVPVWSPAVTAGDVQTAESQP